MKECKDCNCIFVGGMFCLRCGSANIELIKDKLPFKDATEND